MEKTIKYGKNYVSPLSSNTPQVSLNFDTLFQYCSKRSPEGPHFLICFICIYIHIYIYIYIFFYYVINFTYAVAQQLFHHPCVVLFNRFVHILIFEIYIYIYIYFITRSKMDNFHAEFHRSLVQNISVQICTTHPNQ